MSPTPPAEPFALYVRTGPRAKWRLHSLHPTRERATDAAFAATAAHVWVTAAPVRTSAPAENHPEGPPVSVSEQQGYADLAPDHDFATNADLKRLLRGKVAADGTAEAERTPAELARWADDGGRDDEPHD